MTANQSSICRQTYIEFILGACWRLGVACFLGGLLSAVALAAEPVFELSDLLPANGGNGGSGFVLNGIAMDDNSGFSVAEAGDVNGDGVDDLIIGANGASPNGTGSGQSYVVFGTSGGFPPVLNLEDLNGSNGFMLNGRSEFDFSGTSVAGAGDVNGDGVDDLIIGANGAEAKRANSVIDLRI